MDDCHHSLGSNIPLEVLCWSIILLLYLYYYHWFHLEYSAEPSNYNVPLYITNYQNRTKQLQFFNSHWIKTIKKEQIFCKWSIRTSSILSKREQTFWKLSIWNELWILNLGDISFSMVRFHLVHFSVQVSTWWWSKSSRGLVGADGLCIGFIEILFLWVINSEVLCCLENTWFFSWLNLAIFYLDELLGRISVLGIIDYWHCYQLFLHLRLKSLI